MEMQIPKSCLYIYSGEQQKKLVYIDLESSKLVSWCNSFKVNVINLEVKPAVGLIWKYK